MTKKQKKTIKEEIEEVIDALIKDVHYEHTYPAHAAYYQLDFDKMRNALKGFSRKLLQRFIEETIGKEYKENWDTDELSDNEISVKVFFENVKEKQQQWLKENL